MDTKSARRHYERLAAEAAGEPVPQHEVVMHAWEWRAFYADPLAGLDSIDASTESIIERNIEGRDS